MKTTVSWTLSNGAPAAVTVELVTERNVSLDGDGFAVPCCELRIVGTANGGTMGYNVERIPTRQIGSVRVSGTCGRLGIPEAKMDEIDAAIIAAKSTPEWMAHEASMAAKARAEAEYERSAARIARLMAE